ncbi:MAG: membrane integrity-associated transporter subunit PqiC [Gammaproteobacteria bacterium]|nr:membrane integrity-associated transporter subunit PqiC [Gammaproteobacteria bacterium]
MMRTLLALLVLVAVVGCAGGSSIRHYLVDPAPGPVLAAGGAAPLVVEILDVELPRYLDRYPLVRRGADGQVLLASGHQWGEGLRLNLLRTLSINLSEQLGSVDVSTPRTRSASRPDFRVLVVIEAFEANASGQVHLDARWQLMAGSDHGTLTTRLSRLRSEHRLADADHAGQVAAMSELFGRLSAEIARELLSQDPQRGEA